MGKALAVPERCEIDLFAVSGARALKRAGWPEAMIAKAYGTLPPIHMTLAEIMAHNAGLPKAERQAAPVENEHFQGDP